MMGQSMQLLLDLLDCKLSTDVQALIFANCVGIQRPFIFLACPILSL
jgi:hypothetical protein